MSSRPPIPRTVKPRKPVHRFLRVIAVDTETVAVERPKGEVELFERHELPAIIQREPAHIVAVHGAGRLVRELDSRFGDRPNWQFRLTPIHREIWRANRDASEHAVCIKDSTVAFFGWSAPKSKKAGRYFYPLDPLALLDKSIGQMLTGDDPKWHKLLRWAIDVRTFCLEHGLTPRPSSGGLAAQLLRDPRFYPAPRRKVPSATNARAREYLPGNYYRLLAEPRSPVPATYLDMKSAHHSVAAELTFPHADTLVGKGRFQDPQPTQQWARQGTRRYNSILSEHGLFAVSLSVPHRAGGGKAPAFPLPCMKRHGRNFAYLFSNELDYVRQLGCHIEYVIAAWSSPDVDSGLNRFAQWSLAENAAAGETRRAWLKPTLLAAYGVLAAKPRHIEFGYKRAAGGDDAEYPVGSGRLKVKAKRTAKPVESGITNVIHRGMIEAETRIRALSLATDLTAQGFRVLAVYADSVFIEDHGVAIPFLPEPWRIQGYLSDLEFFTPTAFHSRELEKLPGIPRDDVDRLRRLRQFRNLTSMGARRMQAGVPIGPRFDQNAELADLAWREETERSRMAEQSARRRGRHANQ